MGAPRHFLDLDRLDGPTLRRILDLGSALKGGRPLADAPLADAPQADAPQADAPQADAPQAHAPLAGKTLAIILEKPSTRTRVSFDVGMQQLGGRTVVLNGNETHLGRGETVADMARVLSRYVDAIMIRTDASAKLLELASHATVPVINGLTDDSHPCQLMADVMTFEEHRGPIAGRRVAWVGDGNNVAHSWIHAAARFDFALRLACPETLRPSPRLIEWAEREGGDVAVVEDAAEAVAGADCVVTDTWLSMGQNDAGGRHDLLIPYRVDEGLMAAAKPDAIFMHCLPAHRGEEVTAAVMDGPRSVVWDEAENRLHAQKGILAWCLS